MVVIVIYTLLHSVTSFFLSLQNFWDSKGMEEQNINEFHSQGYTIVKNAISNHDLKTLRNECNILVSHLYSNNVSLLKDVGCIIEPLSCGFCKDEENNAFKHNVKAYRRLRLKILGEEVVDIVLDSIATMAGRLLPEDENENTLLLFNEQYIVKPSRTRKYSQFNWHQDSEYMSAHSRAIPTVACWIPLDDVSEQNGTLIIKPYPVSSSLPSVHGTLTPASFTSHHQTLSAQYHTHSDDSSPITIVVSAGSAVFLSSYVRHCSVGNGSDRFRRVFMPQYSCGKVCQSGDGRLVAMAVPCFL